MGEQHPFKLRVQGSNPWRPTGRDWIFRPPTLEGTMMFTRITAVLEDFAPPQPPVIGCEGLFASPAVRTVQSAAQSHEYKKHAGSSDAARTYDTTAK